MNCVLKHLVRACARAKCVLLICRITCGESSGIRISKHQYVVVVAVVVVVQPVQDLSQGWLVKMCFTLFVTSVSRKGSRCKVFFCAQAWHDGVVFMGYYSAQNTVTHGAYVTHKYYSVVPFPLLRVTPGVGGGACKHTLRNIYGCRCC